MRYLKNKYAYKIVKDDYTSPYSKDSRALGCRSTTGRILKYTMGKTISSPNGICTCDHQCCRGIHAYSTKKAALDDFIYFPKGIVHLVKLEAEQWWQPQKNNPHVRAGRVTVVEELF